MKERINNEWYSILQLEKSSPYVFRTRLERVIKHTIKYASSENNLILVEACKNIVEKMNCISDQSNMTSDGCLNSFLVLREDMMHIRDCLEF